MSILIYLFYIFRLFDKKGLLNSALNPDQHGRGYLWLAHSNACFLNLRGMWLIFGPQLCTK